MMVNGGEGRRMLDVEEADGRWGMTRRDIQAQVGLSKSPARGDQHLYGRR